ncbi:MAG TPA: NAD-dependent epimerase/dehydratase family protein [Thermoanaerobaculia bacterium]|nr:NAD-dependent epimerase/dehydratase family protein [Thermoanaerobaculia bacterium]
MLPAAAPRGSAQGDWLGMLNVNANTGQRPVRPHRAGRVRVAVVGAGYVADFHLEALAELAAAGRVEVAAVCDPDLERARAAARRWNVPSAVAALDELPALGIEVAHLLTPPDLHAPLARRLLEAGIGVLVEKPLALASAEARALAALAEERGLPLAVNHNNVHHPAFARLLDAVRAGRLGPVEHVQATLAVPLPQLEAGDVGHWMFREPHHIVFEQAVHPLSQLHALLGAVRSAQATLLGTRELAAGLPFHDRWAVAARAERGTAELFLAFGGCAPRWTVLVLGSDGVAEADLGHDVLWLEEATPWLPFWDGYLAARRKARSVARDARRALSGYLRSTLGLTRRQDPFFAGMRRSLDAFYAALAAGAPLPAGGREGAEVLEWCEAVAAAALPARPAPVADPVPAPGPPRPGEVVILGATGFIGRRVVRALLDRGLPATAVVRRTHALPSPLPEAARAGRLRLVRGRLEDAESLASALAGAATVLHLATGGGDTWEKVERSMVRGSIAAAEAALAAGAARFVYVSSIAALYTGSDGGEGPIEDSLDTDPKPEGRDVYSRGKIATERALLALHRERGLPLVVVRPGVVMGAGTPLQHAGLGLWVRDRHCIGWGRGDRPLPVVAVDDVADALARVAAHPGPDLHGRALNLCPAAPLTAAEVVAELGRATGRPLRFHPRPLWLSQLLEIGKWAVKAAGRRPGNRFPSYRDLKTRALARPFTSRTAREVLGWRPVEEREALLDRAVRVYGRRTDF